MVEVLKSSFEGILPVIEACIKDCSFIAIDTEFTGLSSNELNKNSLFDDGAARYIKQKDHIKQVTVSQIGISIFTEVPKENRYEASTFNFFLFPVSIGPVDVRFTCQSSSLRFLCQHNFDFNKFVYDGIPYLNEEQEILFHQALDDSLMVFESENNFDRREMKLLSTTIAEWLATAKEEDTIRLEKPAGVSDYSIYTQLRQTFPGISICCKDDTHVECQKLEESKRISKQLDEQEKERILDGILGFTRVFRLMVKHRKPLIGHNCMMDLMFIYEKFYRPLPDKYADFKRTLNELFPFLIDTKHVSSHLRPQFKETELFNNTGLMNLYQAFSSKEGMYIVLFSPSVSHSHAYTRYKNKSMIHEAGYDAYMAGYIFVRLAHLVAMQGVSSLVATPLTHRQHWVAMKPYIGAINVIRASINHISIEGPDPVSVRPEWLLVQSKKRAYPLKPLQLEGMFSAYGSVDVLLQGNREALVAVGNHRCAKDILTAFKSHNCLRVTKYVAWKHSPVARSLLWTSALMSGGVCAWLVWSASKKDS
ncbi:PREDICTED: poly(A)-specific ribonuclease PARN-like domain-containing protein 1 [Priapulus caudatus]|uniref:Poly(A)-specific ribonuclease PARN-like domain-containing protein 1 n=1 Tax=Priapulus caudatus TaxID=37621 RepID=A0ABM1E4D7_PRICU|nr:PREDICTED: poly(A)-specific ribonuclease PARN-like domain-containing protein 1 [Priapulus caudatus]